MIHSFIHSFKKVKESVYHKMSLRGDVFSSVPVRVQCIKIIIEQVQVDQLIKIVGRASNKIGSILNSLNVWYG